MTDSRATEQRIEAGVALAIIAAPDRPQVSARQGSQALPGVAVEARGAEWQVTCPIRADLIGEGAQPILFIDDTSGMVLAAFTLITSGGEPGELAAEVAQLRAELELVKAVVRRLARAGGAPS